MSSLPSYGIPDPTATAQAVISQMEANAGDLAAVQAALQQGIGLASGDSFNEVAGVRKALQSYTQRAVNYGQKHSVTPQQAMAQALAAQQAMLAGSMPPREALYTMPGPLQTPPGYPAPGVLPQAPLSPTSTAAPAPSYPPAAAPVSGPAPSTTAPPIAAPTSGTPTAAAPTASTGCTPDNPCYAILPGPGGCAVLEPIYYTTDPLLGSAVKTFPPGQLAQAQAYLVSYNQQHCGQSAAAVPSPITSPTPGGLPAPPDLASPAAPAARPPTAEQPAAGLTLKGPPTSPHLTCDLPEVLAGGIPLPGTADWCDLQTQISAFFTQLGDTLLGWIQYILDPANSDHIGTDIDDAVGGGITGAVVGVVSGSLVKVLVWVAKPVLQAMSDFLGCARQFLGASSHCDGHSMFSLIVCRTVARLLDRGRVGSDAVVWATVDITLHLDPVEKALEYLIAAACPSDIPSVGDTIGSFLRGTVDEPTARCWMAMRGADWTVWEPVLRSRRDRLTAQEAIEWGFRNGWTEDQIRQRLRELGFYDLADQEERLRMHFHLPTIGDQLHFLQRNVFDGKYIQDYRLDEGFLERYWFNFGTQLTAIGVPQETARLHYAAHWVNPAPTEMREFVYRLRPDKPGVANPFSLEDYQRLLVEQDVAPFFRERFRETVYRIPALSYVRDMYRNWIVTDEELKSIHQDLGYSPQDSERFLNVDRLLRARMRSSQAHGWTPAAIAQGYVAGSLPRDRVYALMRDQGFQDWESDALMERAEANLKYGIFVRARSRTISNVALDIQNGLDVGTWTTDAAVQALTALGFDQTFAEGWVGVQQSRAQTRLVKQTVTRLRQGYLKGELDDQGARAALQALNLTPESIDRYLVSWSLSLTPKRRSLSKSEILAETCAGHMTTAEALARLLNLGYSEEDSGLFLADAQQCLVKRRQQAELAEQRKASAAASQIQRLRREAASQARALGSQARRLEPVAKLQKWARLGLIDASYFATRLRSYGYSTSEVDHYWDEAAQAKGSQAQAGATAALHPP